MSFFAIMVSSFLVGLSGALMPGPLTTLAIEQASRLGAGAGLAVAVGHSLLELVTVIALALGLGSVLGRPTVAGAVGLVGALVLTWMGWATIRNAPQVASASSRATASAEVALGSGATGGGAVAAGRHPVFRSAGPMARGIVVSLANPYWSLWWATIGTTYLGLWGGTRLSSLAAFYLGHISSDILWIGLLSLGVAKGVRYLSTRAYRGVLVVLGGFLIALAVFCLYSAVRLLGLLR
ncbi:MAG: LysE family transporter [Bacillota bacterium]|nr:LysE family transporter [Bacillota bacterium]MDI7248701.1 LysE family transporter [Bacillota bacterium]